MRIFPSLLHQVLSKPEKMLSLSLSDWDLLIRQARRAGLLTKLFDAIDQPEQLPQRPLVHLQSARVMTNKHQRDVRWEVRCILEALTQFEHPVLLLKGAAYLMADLPPAESRFFSDIDILVPKKAIESAEKILRLKGWVFGEVDEYDQRYYRTWMHELPPLRHGVRNTILDVHHNILPETAKLHPDANKLLEQAVPVSGYENLYVLSPVDMILHSATHLFHDGELEHGLRDLLDLDALLRHFGKQETFWDQLVERAVELNLSRPLYYALHYTQQVLQTPVPDVAMKAVLAIGKPSAALAWLMNALFSRALMPDHPSCDDAFTPLARWLLYVRSHYLRMPFHLLFPHLIRKAIKKRFSPDQASASKPEGDRKSVV